MKQYIPWYGSTQMTRALLLSKLEKYKNWVTIIEGLQHKQRDIT